MFITIPFLLTGCDDALVRFSLIFQIFLIVFSFQYHKHALNKKHAIVGRSTRCRMDVFVCVCRQLAKAIFADIFRIVSCAIKKTKNVSFNFLCVLIS